MNVVYLESNSVISLGGDWKSYEYVSIKVGSI